MESNIFIRSDLLMYKVLSYIKLYYRYLQTPKGRHDFIDYVKACLIIILSIILVLRIVSLVCEI